MMHHTSYLKIIALAFAALAAPISTKAADISFASANWWITGPTFHLHLEGEIERGDAERIRRIMLDAPLTKNSWIAFSLNSPGGDLMEALEIASLMQDFPLGIVTDVLSRDGSSGSCVSACVLVHLAGKYRYLTDGSRLGVHQFSYAQDAIDLRSRNTETVQRISALITDVISNARVDPKFFSLMATTSPDEVNWVDLDILEDLFVVNRDLSFQESEYLLQEGNLSLVITQIGMYGVNRITARCAGETIIFLSQMTVDERQLTKGELKQINFEVAINRHPMKLRVTPTPMLVDSVASTRFTLDDRLLSTLLSGQRFDVRLVDESGGFLGTGFDLSDGKLGDLIESCTELAPSDPADLGSIAETEDPLSPVLAAASLTSEYGDENRPEPDKRSLEETLISRYNSYLRDWSRANAAAMDAMDRAYGNEIDFYDNVISKQDLLHEKRKFAERWPDRSYAARKGSFEISCITAETCIVAALIDWHAYSPKRGKTAQGVAWYGLGFDLKSGLITFENGESRKY